jgi:hypothetical protein
VHVPAIHRGRQLELEVSIQGGIAHDATNLFCRGRNHPLQGIVEAGVAHGELHEVLEII